MHERCKNSRINCSREQPFSEFRIIIFLSVSSYDTADLLIRCGVDDLNSGENVAAIQHRSLEDVILHPRFDPAKLNYDVAVLLTREDFEMTPSVGTICLPDPSGKGFYERGCFAPGWGEEEGDCRYN